MGSKRYSAEQIINKLREAAVLPTMPCGAPGSTVTNAVWIRTFLSHRLFGMAKRAVATPWAFGKPA